MSRPQFMSTVGTPTLYLAETIVGFLDSVKTWSSLKMLHMSIVSNAPANKLEAIATCKTHTCLGDFVLQRSNLVTSELYFFSLLIFQLEKCTKTELRSITQLLCNQANHYSAVTCQLPTTALAPVLASADFNDQRGEPVPPHYPLLLPDRTGHQMNDPGAYSHGHITLHHSRPQPSTHQLDTDRIMETTFGTRVC